MGWGSRIALASSAAAAIAIATWFGCPCNREASPSGRLPAAAAKAVAPSTSAEAVGQPATEPLSPFERHQREAAARRVNAERERSLEREEIESKLEKLLGARYRRLLRGLDEPLEPTPSEFPQGDPAYAPMGPGGCAAGSGSVGR